MQTQQEHHKKQNPDLDTNETKTKKPDLEEGVMVNQADGKSQKNTKDF